MINLTSLAIILALGLGCADPFSVIAQTSTQQARAVRKVPGATVTGRVTVQGKGKGGIIVGMRPSELAPQMGPAYKGTTDSDGIYRISDVPPGSYQVGPAAPSYVAAEPNLFGNPGKTLILAEGERVDGIDFSIVRGGVITGKIMQSDGKPVIEERVYILPADQQTLRPGFSGSSFQTDDRGVYRMYGLRPGRYKICIGLGEDSFVLNRARQTYQRVFYPSGAELEEAKVVEVGEGTEATNIDITVGPSIPGFSASGIVVDGETALPVANVRFGLQKLLERANAPLAGTTSISNNRGEFRLENITPGKYAVFVIPQPNIEIRVEPVQFEVTDQDVSGLVLKTTKGALLTGVVVVEGRQDQDVYNKLSKLKLFAYVRGNESSISSGFGQASPIATNGGFRLGGLQAGSATFQLAALDFRTQTGFVISRIERDGVVLPHGLEIKAGEEIAGLKIIVAYGNGTVKGTVKWDNGPPPSGARLMARMNKPGENSISIRPQAVDARGYFVFQGIPGGTYELNVNVVVPQSRARQPSARQTITVTDGAVTQVEIVIDSTTADHP